MSIWGKLIGGGIGLVLGGPIGALIGGVAGHVVDRARQGDAEEFDAVAEDGRPEGTRQIAFTIGVIALGAKMAKADGRVTSNEVRAFKEVFQVPEDEVKNVARVFDQAKQDVNGYETYARQIATMFRGEPEVLEDLIAGLMHIARADDVVHPEEIAYLKSVAEIFGLSAADYQRLHATYLGPDQDDPYSILGISADATDDEVKSVYRDLIKKNHPDRVIASGMPEEFVAVATEKLAKINEAYDRIAKNRGIG